MHTDLLFCETPLALMFLCAVRAVPASDGLRVFFGNGRHGSDEAVGIAHLRADLNTSNRGLLKVSRQAMVDLQQKLTRQLP